MRLATSPEAVGAYDSELLPPPGSDPGRDSTVPTVIRLGLEIPLSAARAETLMPLRDAIAPRVSPGRMRYEPPPELVVPAEPEP